MADGATLVPGGGAGPQLTADLVARAIIAAALAFGDDPVIACTTASARRRRALSAAAAGLAKGAEVSVGRAQSVLGLSHCAIRQARRTQGAPWEVAELAAMRAVEFALWRPDAAESIVGGDAGEDLGVEGPLVLLAVEPDEPEVAPAAKPSPVIPILTALVPEGLKRPPPGPIASRMQPTQTMRHMLPAEGERPVRDLVLEALAGGPKDSMNLASCVDRKEMGVVNTLNALEREGVVASEPVEDGPRRYRWKLTEQGRGA